MRELVGHKKDVRAVAYLPDGKLVSGGSDRTVRIWDSESWELEQTIKARTPVYAVAVTSDGSTIAYAGRHAGREAGFTPIRTYRLDTQQPGTTFEFPYRALVNPSPYYPNGEPRSIWSLSYSGDGDTLAAVGRVMGGGNMPNGGGGHWFHTDETASGPLALATAYALRFGSTGERLAVTSAGTASFFATARDSEPVTSYPLQSSWAAAIEFLPDSPLAVVGVNSALYFVNTRSDAKPKRVKTGFRTIAGLAASPDGQAVFVAGKPGGVEVYDTSTGDFRLRYDFGVGGVHAIAASPDGLTVALAGDDGLAVFDWDV